MSKTFHLVKVFLKYFILFDAVVDWIVSLISFLNSLLLVYRNAVFFFMLILYSATLLTLFITSKSFLVETSGFLYVVSCILKTDNIISSFLIQMHFISVSRLITLAGTSNIRLNRFAKCGHPCLVPDLRGKLLAFYH